MEQLHRAPGYPLEAAARIAGRRKAFDLDAKDSPVSDISFAARSGLRTE